jgi:iron complex transport system substrate-binding protein
VTFECDHPPEARERRIVSTSALPEGLDSAGIDAFVAAAMRAGEDLYHLDEGALSGLDADLVVTQDLCAVCAVDVAVVDDALAHLGCTAQVLTIDPHDLEEVLASIGELGAATGHRAEADHLVTSLRTRLDKVRDLVATRSTGPAPRVLLLEWTDPPFAPGHWVPEMVTAAGGVPTIGEAGEKSVRVTWDQALAIPPDVIVCAPCGYDLAGSTTLARKLVSSGVLPDRTPVWAVDANASFARPGPRLVDGVETLAQILDQVPEHPDRPVEGAAERIR